MGDSKSLYYDDSLSLRNETQFERLSRLTLLTIFGPQCREMNQDLFEHRDIRSGACQIASICVHYRGGSIPTD